MDPSMEKLINNYQVEIAKLSGRAIIAETNSEILNAQLEEVTAQRDDIAGQLNAYQIEEMNQDVPEEGPKGPIYDESTD